MQHGILKEWDAKEVQKKVKAGEPVEVGVSAISLCSDIEFHLFNSGYDPKETLQRIHKDLLVLTGKVRVNSKEDSEK